MSMLTQLASCYLVSVKTLCTLCHTLSQSPSSSTSLMNFVIFQLTKKKENKQPRMDEMSDLKSLHSCRYVRLTRRGSQGQSFALHFVLLHYWSCSVRPQTFKWKSELSLAGCLRFILLSLLKRQGGKTELAANHIPIICRRNSQDSTR